MTRTVHGAAVMSALVLLAGPSRAEEPKPADPKAAESKPAEPKQAEPRGNGAAKELVAAVLPPGPWKQSLLFDINANVPKLSARNFQILGDVMLGWNAERWGVTARGYLYSYDVTNGKGVVQIDQRELTVEGWGVLRPTPALRIELRAVGFLSYFDSTRVYTSASTNRLLFDETSFLGRGVAQLALRYEPSARGSLGIWLGGGFQVENYLPTTVTKSGEITPEDVMSVSAVGHARLRGNVDFVPNILGGRVRVDCSLYQIQRDSEIFTVSDQSLTHTFTTSRSTQIDMHARLFLDAQIISFFGFVPQVSGGFDLLYVNTTDQGSMLTVAPNFGAGIRRQTF